MSDKKDRAHKLIGLIDEKIDENDDNNIAKKHDEYLNGKRRPHNE